MSGVARSVRTSGADIKKHGQRHILFYTPECLRLLSVSKSWYIDGTFQVVGRPFSQLLSIHRYVKGSNCVKQVPLAFVLMSRRKTKDYKAVFKAIRSRLPCSR